VWAKAIEARGLWRDRRHSGRGQHGAQSDAYNGHAAGKEKPPKFVEAGVMQRVARVRLWQLQCDMYV